MTIDEAIQILTLDKKCEFEGDARDLEDALQLSIEALKRLEVYRNRHPELIWQLLPGEDSE